MKRKCRIRNLLVIPLLVLDIYIEPSDAVVASPLLRNILGEHCVVVKLFRTHQ